MSTTESQVFENELIIYPVHIKNEIIEECFIKQKFREIDRSDLPGISLKLFSAALGLAQGMKLTNPIFSQSFGVNMTYLNTVIPSLQALSKRGYVYLSKEFPTIDERYVTASIGDYIYMAEHELIPHQDNPYYKNGYTHNPVLKSHWTIVYIVSLCSQSELKEKGLDYGYLTRTQNDAVQLCELISKGDFPPPIGFHIVKNFADPSNSDSDAISDSEESIHYIEFNSDSEGLSDSGDTYSSESLNDSDLESVSEEEEDSERHSIRL